MTPDGGSPQAGGGADGRRNPDPRGLAPDIAQLLTIIRRLPPGTIRLDRVGDADEGLLLHALALREPTADAIVALCERLAPTPGEGLVRLRAAAERALPQYEEGRVLGVRHLDEIAEAQGVCVRLLALEHLGTGFGLWYKAFGLNPGLEPFRLRPIARVAEDDRGAVYPLSRADHQGRRGWMMFAPALQPGVRRLHVTVPDVLLVLERLPEHPADAIRLLQEAAGPTAGGHPGSAAGDSGGSPRERREVSGRWEFDIDLTRYPVRS